jgi:hypothetical protein
MTSANHPTQTVRGAETVPNPQQPGGSGRMHGPMLANARRLQRKGFTLSEIAEEMDCRRSTIERMLYWEVINDD